MENAAHSDFSVLRPGTDRCVPAGRPEDLRDPLALAWEGQTVVADWEDRQAEPRLLELEAALGPRLLVPEVWRQVLPQAGILIPAALSGGTLRQRLREAAEESPGRCWLRLEPVRQRFSLPCPTGCGEALTREALEAKLAGVRTFFSEALCCRYAYDLSQGAAMILYDTPETLSKKEALAREAGFRGAVMF